MSVRSTSGTFAGSKLNGASWRKSMSQSFRRVTSSALIAALAAVSLTCARARKAEVRTPKSNTLVLRYQDFGPPSVSYALLGMEWYQWNSQGPDDPNADDDDVKVVVYRNVPLDEVRKDYPVVERKQDYRYLEYKAALDLLNKYEADSFWDQYPETKERTGRTKERILEQLGD